MEVITVKQKSLQKFSFEWENFILSQNDSYGTVELKLSKEKFSLEFIVGVQL